VDAFAACRFARATNTSYTAAEKSVPSSCWRICLWAAGWLSRRVGVFACVGDDPGGPGAPLVLDPRWAPAFLALGARRPDLVAVGARARCWCPSWPRAGGSSMRADVLIGGRGPPTIGVKYLVGGWPDTLRGGRLPERPSSIMRTGTFLRVAARWPVDVGCPGNQLGCRLAAYPSIGTNSPWS